MNELKEIPYLGAGIGLRMEIAKDTLANNDEIEVVEVIAEHYFSGRHPNNVSPLLAEAQKRFPIIPHGVDLSIGSAAPLEDFYLREAKALVERLSAHYYSDHFCLTRDGDELDIGHLSPLWYTKEMLDLVCSRVDTVQQFIGKPLVLENITAPFTIPENEYEEPEFITEVCRRTGCGLLLDVTNVFINGFNHKHDAQKMLERYPMDHVVHMHLAGGFMENGQIIDSHSRPVNGINDGVWPLFEWAVMHSDVKAVIIERDDDFDDDFDEVILHDLRHIKAILAKKR